MDGPGALVGREAELAALAAALDDAAHGRPRHVLVRGEAGIGKTTLVGAAVDALPPGEWHVLHGQCLRFGTDVSSYLPFTNAVTRWGRGAGGRVGGGRPRTVADLVPALSDPSSANVPLQVGAFLDTLQEERPTVLVLDDLHWADPSSLDVLAYLVAGLDPGQRLALVATYRDTDLGEGHRLHGWLADVRRMPGVAELALTPMDLWSVERLVLAHGVTDSAAVLAADVLRRSDGNPYLAELLIAQARAGDDGPGAGAADRAGLAEVLAASWHRLGPPGRRLTQLLAVAGAPVAPKVLRELAAGRGLDADAVREALADAGAQGIVVETDSGALWFRHPLLAETIAATLGRAESDELHADLAAAWLAAGSVDARERANALALHHVASGDAAAGLEWSLRAAREAAAIRAWDEQATHLSTAASLLDGSDGPAIEGVDRVGLEVRAARAWEVAGDDAAAVEHYEEALGRIDRATDPLAASRVLLELHILRDMAGLGSSRLSTAEPLEVLELTEPGPPSEERALAFAHLAFAEAFNGSPGAGDHAETAVGLATAVGSDRARIWALGARSQTRWGTDAGVADAEEALALAVAAADPQLQCRAAVFLNNNLESVGAYGEAAQMAVGCYTALREVGQLDYAATVGAMAARGCFGLGRWEETRVMVRQLLGVARSDIAAAAVRCVAALLTAHEGDAAAATLHLRRAEELLPVTAPVGDPLLDTQIRLAIALGRPGEGLGLVTRYLAEALEVSHLAADEWLELASNAAVLVADSAPAEREVVAARLAELEAVRGEDPARFAPASRRDLVRPALGALYAAQRAHVLGNATAQHWEAAVRATSDAGMRLEQARSLVRLARLLLSGRGSRGAAEEALATAMTLSTAMGARPLTATIEALALQAHIALAGPEPRRGTAAATTHRLPWDEVLTPREREVLEHLLAGQTYGRIAAVLFISEKTVSSHVSTILRKTGARSRIELAALAASAAAPD